MRMQPDFEKANEIYFRLGIIYKQQQKYNQSLEVRIVLLSGLLLRLTLILVLQIHCYEPAKAIDRRGHMVSNRPRP